MFYLNSQNKIMKYLKINLIKQVIKNQQNDKPKLTIFYIKNKQFFVHKYFLSRMRERQRRHTLRQSPRRQMINQQLDDHSVRIKQLLKADITMLEQQNTLLKTKCKKLNELQDKVQLVLRQNNQLLGENQKMTRLLHQHKSENQMLKNKLDQQNGQRIGLISEFQFKEKKLLSQIESLSSQINELDNLKSLQINEAKSQFQMDIQNLKRQNGSALEAYEQEIRKLKQAVDRREFQIGDLSSRLKKQGSQFQYEIMKSKEQKQKLINQIGYIEADNKKDLQQLRMRLDSSYMEEIQQIKRAHLNDLQIIQNQNFKLKDMINKLSLDNQKIKGEIDKSANYYQDTISILKREIDDLKLQLIQLEKISENQKADIQDDLVNLHKKQVTELKYLQDDHLRKLQNEIITLQSINQGKTNQIQQLIRQKATSRSVFDNENSRLKQQVQMYKDKINELDVVCTTKIKSLQNRIEDKDKQLSYLDQLHRDMKANSDSEIASLKQLLSQKKIELEKLKISSKQAEQQAIQEKNSLLNEKQQLSQALRREQKQKQIQKQNYETLLNQTDSSLRSKIETLITKINMIQKQNQGLKKNILLKQKQVKGLKDRVNEGEARQLKLQAEINQYREKLLQKDKKNNEALQQQKSRIQKSNLYLIENIRNDNQAALRLEAAKQKQLKEKLNKKEKELQSLLKMHKKMCDQVKGLTQQQANKKNIDLKFPGATADLIATKNMFDVFLKTKVLDVCSDAMASKENIPEDK